MVPRAGTLRQRHWGSRKCLRSSVEQEQEQEQRVKGISEERGEALIKQLNNHKTLGANTQADVAADNGREAGMRFGRSSVMQGTVPGYIGVGKSERAKSTKTTQWTPSRSSWLSGCAADAANCIYITWRVDCYTLLKYHDTAPQPGTAAVLQSDIPE
ncbi:hypothetical protein V493_06522 [Pseudogymnoascus sp. VKM F-4281 (FW-2241)]|nr:hypothetical protein V493_06522 [Pseudogymnoascus sp. VKM F-4281 (FW-2241)]